MTDKGGTRFLRFHRAGLSAYIGAFIGLLLAGVVVGRVFVFSVLVLVLATMAVGFQTYVIRRSRGIEAAANRTHPDYAAIAAMEREIYGETFRHEGGIASMLLPGTGPPQMGAWKAGDWTRDRTGAAWTATRDGTGLAAGWVPGEGVLPPELHPLVTPEVPPGLFETIIETRRERIVSPKPSRCYCSWCRGRAGVHGDEAKAMYQAEVAAAMAQCRDRNDDEHRPNLRRERPS